MSKYADWSPASVFGSTVQSPASCKTSSSLSPVKPKTSPQKANLTVNLQSQIANNNEEIDEENNKLIQHIARVKREENLAALLLQRQFQVWILRRQEVLRVHEVEKLREKLRQAAAKVIKESFYRYFKRQQIYNYLNEVENFELRVKNLLQNCINRKREKEADLQISQKKEKILVKVYEKLRHFVRRWKLQKRCKVRILAREREKQLEIRRCSCAKVIFAFYRVYKLRCSAKKQLQQLKYRRDGLLRLFPTLKFATLKIALKRWQEGIFRLKMAENAAKKLQRVYREHFGGIKHLRRVKCCLVLQCFSRRYLARVHFVKLKTLKRQEIWNKQRQTAAIEIQRRIRGYLTCIWVRKVLCKLRERFKCENCGAVEPGGKYCKYCGRHRTMKSQLNVLSLHEKWQLRRFSSSNSVKNVQEMPKIDNNFSILPLIIPVPQKPVMGSRSAALRVLGSSSSIEPLSVMATPLHRRLVLHKAGTFSSSRPLLNAKMSVPRRNSISSLSEQTTLRAAALTTLQAKMTASLQAKALEIHLKRLEKANMTIQREKISNY